MRLVSLSRNFGQQASLICGFQHSSGNAVIELDCKVDLPFYLIEELIEKGDKFKKFMDYADIVVDGKFDLSKRDLTIPFRGSSNQRVVSVSDSEFAIATHRLDRRKMVCSPMP